MIDEVVESVVSRAIGSLTSRSCGCTKCKGEYRVRNSNRRSIDSGLTSQPRCKRSTSNDTFHVVGGPGRGASAPAAGETTTGGGGDRLNAAGRRGRLGTAIPCRVGSLHRWRGLRPASHLDHACRGGRGRGGRGGPLRRFVVPRYGPGWHISQFLSRGRSPDHARWRVRLRSGRCCLAVGCSGPRSWSAEFGR